ncbi:FAD-binding and (Fe-S)-binding domain-containing protein [Rhodococcus sp. NPDC054953]
MPVDRLEADLRSAIAGEVDFSARRRAEYSTDASNYRVVPRGVVAPRDAADVLAVREICAAHRIPLTGRGAGTSVAGNAIGPGLVLDFSRHMNGILDVDPVARTARVQPGVVLARLAAAAAPHGLRFGPDPSTHTRCTVGGTLGNNACGPHALAYGRTSDNVVEMDWLTGDGRRFVAADDPSVVDGLDRFTTANLAVLRTELGRFSRQVSGYSLEHLLPERGHHLARALVGTEGTCGLALEATVRLHPASAAPALAVLGYDSMPDAADDVPNLLPFKPLAMEGMDSRLVDVVRRVHGNGAVPALPRGRGWLFVEMAGDTVADGLDAGRLLIAASNAVDAAVLPPGPDAARLWKIRADGAGLAGRTASGGQAWPGWEDAAVPPERLGRYLREFDDLMTDHGVEGLVYGHFGDGCVHVRIDLPLEDRPEEMRPFIRAASHLVLGHGGSPSGEHGDGRARGELLADMYSPAALAAFRAFKALFDPDNLCNPGVIVDPEPFDHNLRRPAALPLPATGGFGFTSDGGDLSRAVHRCVGVGKCRADDGFMCPSYRATRDEKDSTRGRARVLQDMANGSLIRGWNATEVRDSLDLCLSCKACGSECPTGIDMASYKSETLYRAYRGRVRPISHYTLGRLPTWARLASPVAALVNAATRRRAVARPMLALAGVDTRRSMVELARRRFTASTADPRRDGPAPLGSIVLWSDSFTEYFRPGPGHAAVRLLEDAGYGVEIAAPGACCGLTLITTGQLDAAKRRLRDTVHRLGGHVAAGRAIVGVEPSCTAVLRSDLTELLPGDPRAAAVAESVRTLGELLDAAMRAGWRPPRLDGLPVVVQPHCHQHAVMGYDADLRVLRAAGADVVTVAGCCGLAGNFGMEKGHYEISVRIAEAGVLQQIRDHPGATVLADGFSCSTQIRDLAGIRSLHLAELLDGAGGSDAATR